MGCPEDFHRKYPLEISDVDNSLAEAAKDVKFAITPFQRHVARTERLRQVFGSDRDFEGQGEEDYDQYCRRIQGTKFRKRFLGNS